MQYMVLLYDSEQIRENMSPQEHEQVLNDFMALAASAKEAGVPMAGNPLCSVDTATTVRIRGGETLITDGPFAETKEQLGGYLVLECKDLDEALRWAAKVPVAKWGSVEVRPVRVIDGLVMA